MPTPIPFEYRADLKLLEAESDHDGFPQWLAYDPSKHKYYLIGWLEFEILSRWHLGTVENIVDSVNKETTLTINSAHIYQVIDFLDQNNLVVINNKTNLSKLISRRVEENWAKKFIQSYLFFMIPLIKPNLFLEKTLPLFKFLFFNKYTKHVLILVTIIGLYLTSRQWEQFFHTFDYSFSFENLAAFTIAIIFVKIIHELGHAYIAKFKGCNVATIGVAFLVMWPVLYTDTTDVWKLKHKKDRLLIAAGGMIAEFILAIFSLLLWHFAPLGITKTIFFFIATISLLSSILINTNPLLRFDGYYFFSDLIGIDNLQNTAFTIGAWKLREWLFKFNEPPPILFPREKEKLIIFYAYFTWIYRFFLFISIALLVYYFFFKVLGIILLVVEILFFILMPIGRELKNYWDRRSKVTMNKNSIITFSSLAIMLSLFLIPWHTQINAPGVVEYSQQLKIFSQVDGYITRINFHNGEYIEKNQLLLKMESPKIKNEIQLTKIDIDKVKTRIRQERERSSELGFKQANIADLQALSNKYRNLQEEYDKLTIKAPFYGQFFSSAKGRKKGVWLGKKTLIGELINSKSIVIYAYVSEKDIHRIAIGAKAYFYPQEDNGKKLQLKVVKIDTAATEILPSPYLASYYGGDIAVSKESSGQIKVKEALYRVKLKMINNTIHLKSIVRGDVLIKGKRESYAKRAWQLISAVIIRESMF